MYPYNQSSSSSSSKTSHSSGSNQLLEKLKLFDFYPKLDESVQQSKSVYGGVATVICIIVTVFLLTSEIYYYTFPIRDHSLRVDVSRGNRMNINFDVHFPSLVCSDIIVESVDGIDGNPIKDAAYQIIKERLTKRGSPLDRLHARAGYFSCTKCELPPKFQLIEKRRCCNSCEDLREFYRQNKVPQHHADESTQCKIGKPITDDEGCRVYGTLSVQKLKGDIHIIAGRPQEESHDGHSHHVHKLTPEIAQRIHKFNISHHIHKFSFGQEVDGLINPLEGFGIVVPMGLGLQTYYIQVVPTIYKQNNYILDTNQYSYTREYKSINYNNLGYLFPGIYFKYDLSPLMIEVDQSSKPFSELITSICAIGGGMYVAFGLFYHVSSRIVSKLKQNKKQ